MSEHNYASLAFKHKLKDNPDLFGHIGADGELSEAFKKTQNENLKERQALRAKDDARKVVDVRKEYDRLRQELFGLKENVKNSEIRANTEANEVKGLEDRIADLLKRKIAAVENPRLESGLQHQIDRLEAELLDRKIAANQANHGSINAIQALKAFEGHKRIAELKAELDAPAPKV